MLTSLLIATALMQSPAAPSAQWTGPRKRAAVTGFEVKIQEITVFANTPSGVPEAARLDITEPMMIGDGMADMLVTALVESKRYVVLERRNLKDVEDEVKLEKPPEDGKLPPADQSLLAGRVLGAQLLLRGALTELSYKRTSQGASDGLVGVIQGGNSTFTATAAIDLKIIEVSTGRILDSVKSEGTVTNRSRFIGFTRDEFAFGKSSFDSSPIAKALRKAIENGVKLLNDRAEKLPWEGRIASISKQDPNVLYLNFGADAGLKPGTELEIFAYGETVTDPETGVVIGREEDTVVGKCRIRSATKTMTTALLLSGEGLRPGLGVRLPSSAGTGFLGR